MQIGKEEASDDRGQSRGERGSKNKYALTVLDAFHIAPRLALRAELHKVFHAQAKRELLLELIALVQEEHDRDVPQQLGLA